MFNRRRFFALPGVMLAALPQMPWERHDEQPEMTPRELTDEVWRIHAVTNTHTMMFRLVNGRLAGLEAQILTPGRRLKGGKV